MALAKTSSILYGILRPIIRWGAYFFIRRRGISGKENFPVNQPVILISNHQNAMLDPVFICIYVPKQIHWLARADVFKKGFISKLLHNFNMMPVYRERDGVSNMRDENVKIFQECFDRLKGKAVISMFPEGTHRGKKQLIAFKKGLSRLAFGAMETHPEMKDLVILPVGLDYSDFFNYHPEFNLKIGKPIRVEPFYEEYKKDQLAGIQSLQNEARSALNKLIIDVRNEDFYDIIIQLRGLVFKLSNTSQLKDQFDVYERTSKEIEKLDVANPAYNVLKMYAEEIQKRQLNEMDMLSKGKHAVLTVLLGCAAPIYILARLFFLPLEKFIEGFIAKNIKDDLFKNSIRTSFWTFITPLYLAIIGAVFKVLSSCSWTHWFIGLALILISGRIAIAWIRAYRKWQGANKWRKILSRTTKEDSAFLENRNATMDIVKSLIK